MNKNRITKPVAINITSERDKRILKHIEGLNFSGYVKDLIDADITKWEEIKRRREAGKVLKIVEHKHNGGIKIVIE